MAEVPESPPGYPPFAWSQRRCFCSYDTRPEGHNPILCREHRLETAIIHLLNWMPTDGHARMCPMHYQPAAGPCECHVAAMEYAAELVENRR